MKKTFETSIEINAPAEKVWKVLIENESYPDWNPYLRSVEGVYAKGKTVTVKMQPPGDKVFVLKPVVLGANFPELRWKGKFLSKRLFSGEHYFRLEKLSPQTSRFIQGENFSGLLIGVMGPILKKTVEGYEKMNKALKEKSEQIK